MSLAYVDQTKSSLQVCNSFKKKCPYPASEGLATLGADEGGWDKVWVVITFEVHVQQLLLSEGLLTLATGVWFLSSVCSTMHHHVALLDPPAWDTDITIYSF